MIVLGFVCTAAWDRSVTQEKAIRAEIGRLRTLLAEAEASAEGAREAIKAWFLFVRSFVGADANEQLKDVPLFDYMEVTLLEAEKYLFTPEHRQTSKASAWRQTSSDLVALLQEMVLAVEREQGLRKKLELRRARAANDD